MVDDVVARLRKDRPLSWEDRFEAADEISRLREENARLRRSIKTAYAEGCYDSSKTEKTQEEFEALWQKSFAYNVICGGANNESP